MADSNGYMEYDFASLKKIRVVEQKEAMSIRKDIIHMFRKPYLKHDMTTHGPLWNQYSFPQETITICDLELEQDSSGYIYVEGKGKNFYVFSSTLSTFIQYLQSREDGLFPAIYFVDREYTMCLCENGERGSMKPVYLYRGGNR